MKRSSSALARNGGANDEEDSVPEKAQGVRYINDDMIIKVSGQRNLALITELDLTLSKEGGKKIRYIENLEKLKKLQVLSLSYNMIEKVEKLDSLTKLKELNLSFNRISRIEGLESLVNLQVLNLNGNLIQVIPAWLPKKLKALRNLKLAKNSIVSLEELKKLRPLANLSQLMCSENPISEMPHCRAFLIFHLRSMDVLDGQKVHPRDRADADQRFAQEEVEDLQTQLMEMERRYEALSEEHNRSVEDYRSSQDKTAMLRQLHMTEAERISQLEAEVEAKNELLKKKSSELSKACQKHYQLEQELAFFKIDSKFSKLGEKPPSPEPEDTEVSLIAESPYIGRAKYTTNAFAHERMLPRGGRQLQLMEPVGDGGGLRNRRALGQLEHGAESMDYDIQIVARRKAIEDAENKLSGLRQTLSETEDQIVFAAEQLLQLTAATGSSRPLTDPEKEALKLQYQKKMASISDLKAKAQKINAMLGPIDEEKEALEAQIGKVEDEMRGLDSNHPRYAELASTREDRVREAQRARTAGEKLRGELERLGSLLKQEMHAARVLEQHLIHGQTLPAGLDSDAAKQDLVAVVSSLKDYLGRRGVTSKSPQAGIEEELRLQRDELMKKVTQLESEMSVLDAEASENNDLRRKMKELQQAVEKEKLMNEELQQKLNDTVAADADLSTHLRDTEEEVARLQHELEKTRKEASATQHRLSQTSAKADGAAVKQLKDENKKLVAKLEQCEAELRSRMQAAGLLLEPERVLAKLQGLLNNVEQKKLPVVTGLKDPFDKACAELQTSLVEKIKRSDADVANARRQAEKIVADTEELKSAQIRQLEMEIARHRRAYEAKEAATAEEIRKLQELLRQAEQAQSSDTDGMSLIDEMRSELGDLRKQLYDKQATAAEQLAEAQNEIERLNNELEMERRRTRSNGGRRQTGDPVLFHDQQPRRNRLSPSKRPTRPQFEEAESSDGSAWPSTAVPHSSGKVPLPNGSDGWITDEDASRIIRNEDRHVKQMADELRHAHDEVARLRGLLNERERLLNEESAYADRSDATIDAQRQELERLQAQLQHQEGEIDRLNDIISRLLTRPLDLSKSSDVGSQPQVANYVKAISEIQDRLDELKTMIEPSINRQQMPMTPVSTHRNRGASQARAVSHPPSYEAQPSFMPEDDSILPDWRTKVDGQQNGIVTSTPHGNRMFGPRPQPHHSIIDGRSRPDSSRDWQADGSLVRPLKSQQAYQDQRRVSFHSDHQHQRDAVGPDGTMDSALAQQPLPCSIHRDPRPTVSDIPYRCPECHRLPHAGPVLPSQRCTLCHPVPLAPGHAAAGGVLNSSGQSVCRLCASQAAVGNGASNGPAIPGTHSAATKTAAPAQPNGTQQTTSRDAAANLNDSQVVPQVPQSSTVGSNNMPHVIVLPSTTSGQPAALAGQPAQLQVVRCDSMPTAGHNSLFCNVQDHHELEDTIASLQQQLAKLKSKERRAKKRFAELNAVQVLQHELEKRQRELESLSATVEEQTTEMHRLRDIESDLVTRKQNLQDELSALRGGNSKRGEGRMRRAVSRSRGAEMMGDERSVSDADVGSVSEAEDAEKRLQSRESYLLDEIRCLEETISKRRAELLAADRRLRSCQSDLEMAKREALTTVLTYDEAQEELDAAAEEAAVLRETAAEARADLEELTEKLRELEDQKQEKEKLCHSAETLLVQREAQLAEIDAVLQSASIRLRVLEDECKLKEEERQEGERVSRQAHEAGELLNQRLRDVEELEAKLKAKRGDLQAAGQALAETRSDVEAAAARATQERHTLEELASDGAKLRTEIQDKKRLIESLQLKQEELETSVMEGEARLSRIASTMQSQQRQVEQADAELQSKREELYALQESVDQARHAADEANRSVSSLNADVDRIRLQVEMAEKELAELSALCQVRQTECSRLDASAKERSEALRALAVEKESMEHTLASAANERDRLQAVCDALQEKATEIKRAQHARDESLRAGEHQLQQLQQQQAAVTKELEQMAEKRVALSRESALQDQQLKDLRSEQQKLKKQISDYEDRLKRLEKEAAIQQANFDSKNALLQQAAADEEVVKRAVADARQQLETCREATSAAEYQFRQLDADRAERQRSVEQLARELSLQQDRLADTRAEGEKQLEALSREIAAKRAALESVAVEYAALTEQMTTKMRVASQVQDLEGRLAAFDKENTQLLVERERLLGNLTSLQQQLESAHERLQRHAKNSADITTQHRKELDDLYSEINTVKQRYAADIERLEDVAQGHSRRADRFLSELGEARLQLQQMHAKLQLQEELAAKDKHLEATLETIKSEIHTEVAHGLTELEKSRSEAAIQLSDLQLQRSQMEHQLETFKENLVRSTTRPSKDAVNPWSTFDRESAAKREAMKERFLLEQNQLRDKLFEQMSSHISSLERARSQSDNVLSNLQKKVVDLEEVLSTSRHYGTDTVPSRLSAGRASTNDMLG